MDTNRRNIKVLPYIFYGDALGFSKENTNPNNNELIDFTYLYNESIKLKAQSGQWSYITQIMLINCKCLRDDKEKKQVVLDYKRMNEEVKLLNHYSCGVPLNYSNKLKLGKNYYSSDFYWNDMRGAAFSRVIPLALSNKNFSVSQNETYKSMIYVNRHPQVVLTGLLLNRAIYLFLDNATIEKDELLDQLKNYLIDLRLQELEEDINTQLPSNYNIKFEQEKINYLMDIDRLKDVHTLNLPIINSKTVLLASLFNFFNIAVEEDHLMLLQNCIEKEVYAITYAFLALAKKVDKVDCEGIKDISFINNMDEYLSKLKEYEVGRDIFEKIDYEVDLFLLNIGALSKHPILNNIKVKDKIEHTDYIEMHIQTKSGDYVLIKTKK